MKKKTIDDYKTIKTTRTEYEKVGGRWKRVDQQRYLMSENEYKNFTDDRWASQMRSLGGYERADRRYTFRGYRVTRNTSISPDRDQKIVVDFDFNGSRKIYDRASKLHRGYYRKKINADERLF